MFLMRLFSSDKKKPKQEVKTESKAESSLDSECYTAKPWTSLASAYDAWLAVNSEQNLLMNIQPEGIQFLDLTQAEFNNPHRISAATPPMIIMGENQIFRFKWDTNSLTAYQVISDEYSKKPVLKGIVGKSMTISPGSSYAICTAQLFKYDENTLLFFGVAGNPEGRQVEPEGLIFDLIDIKTMRSKNRTFHPCKYVDIANSFFDKQNRLYLTTSSSSLGDFGSRGMFEVNHGSTRLLCYQFNSDGQAKKISDTPLPKPIIDIWPSPVEKHLLVAFEVDRHEKNERCQLVNCEVNKGSLVKKEILGDIYVSQSKNVYIMPNGQVIYPEIAKDDKVKITSTSLITSHKKVLAETNSTTDIFVKTNGECPQVGVISYTDKTRKLYPLGKDEPEQKAIQTVDECISRVETKENASASLTSQPSSFVTAKR